MSKHHLTSLDEPILELSPDQQAIRDEVFNQLRNLQSQTVPPTVGFTSPLDVPMVLVIEKSTPTYEVEITLTEKRGIDASSPEDALKIVRQIPGLIEIKSIRKVTE